MVLDLKLQCLASRSLNEPQFRPWTEFRIELEECKQVNHWGWPKMRALILLCFVIAVGTSTPAQEKAKARAEWLFPQNTDLLAAGQLGFVSDTDVALKQVYERASGYSLPERMTHCLDKVEHVQVAGPRTLAAIRGRIAKKQGAKTPQEDWVLESRGEVLLSVEFYAHKEQEEAQASLWQDGLENRPVWQHVMQRNYSGCDVKVMPGQNYGGVPSQTRYRVQQWYILRFDPDSAVPDWNKSFKLSIRRADGQTEEYQLALGAPLEQQAEELH